MIEAQRNNGHQVAMDMSSKNHQATEDSGPLPIKHENESDPPPNKSIHLNWEMFAIWSFVAFSFAALFVAGYIIWINGHGR